MPCLAHEELELAMVLGSAALPQRPLDMDRLEWLIQRHNVDGSHGCDWCLLAEEIRRLRAVLAQRPPADVVIRYAKP